MIDLERAVLTVWILINVHEKESHLNRVTKISWYNFQSLLCELQVKVQMQDGLLSSRVSYSR